MLTVTLVVGVASTAAVAAELLGMLCRRTPLSGTSGTDRVHHGSEISAVVSAAVGHVGPTAVAVVTAGDRVAMVGMVTSSSS